jgi:hypothetical protein
MKTIFYQIAVMITLMGALTTYGCKPLGGDSSEEAHIQCTIVAHFATSATVGVTENALGEIDTLTLPSYEYEVAEDGPCSQANFESGYAIRIADDAGQTLGPDFQTYTAQTSRDTDEGLAMLSAMALNTRYTVTVRPYLRVAEDEPLKIDIVLGSPSEGLREVNRYYRSLDTCIYSFAAPSPITVQVAVGAAHVAWASVVPQRIPPCRPNPSVEGPGPSYNVRLFMSVGPQRMLIRELEVNATEVDLTDLDHVNHEIEIRAHSLNFWGPAANTYFVVP